MKRKLTSLILVILMTCSFILSPIKDIKALSDENTQIVNPTKEYSNNKVTTIENGVGAIEASEEDVTTFKDLDNFTMNTTLTMSAGTSTVQSIFFLGDSTQNSNYISIYFTPGSNKIGIESKTGGINTSFTTSVTITDGQPHTFTFTVSKGNYYRFYLDGEMVNEGKTATTFSKGIVPNADHMIFGNGKRASNGNGYPLNGTLKNIELFDSAISEEQILQYHENGGEEEVFSYKNAYYKNISDTKYENTSVNDVNNLKSLESGSITVRYRANAVTNQLMTLFSLSDSTDENKYFTFYVNPSSNSIGVEVKGGMESTANGNFVLNNNHLTEKSVSIKDTKWHTLTVVKTDSTNNNRYTFYIDGKMVNYYSNKKGFLNNVTSANTISIGQVKRGNNASTMPFEGAIDYVKVIEGVLTESEIKSLHQETANTTTTELDLTNAYKTTPYPIFYSGYDGSTAYRIPSLLTTKDGTLIAAIDKRNQHSGDWGNIDTMIRRKEAGDKDFRDGKVILDLADNDSGSANSAFLIDPSMVQDEETGRIYLLVDMYPESSGLANTNILETGTGYKKVDGKDYQLLYDSSNNEYTIRENGNVYNAENKLTEYKIITECEAPYKELGNIYKNGEYKGNIYMFSGKDAGELHVLRTSYLWLMHSDDDGKTWSKPKDITPQVKKEWMEFIGTGPGVGIQLKNGKLVFPVYHTNSNVGASQSSAVIISEDNGETWTIGESPNKTYGNDPETMTGGGMLTESQVIQTNNGELKLFMRNTIANTVYVATSNDDGKTWYKIENDINIPEIYCQLSVIDFEKDGKEYVMISNPSKSGRIDGKVHLGEISENGDITWTNSQLLSTGHFQYSCLTQLPNGKFAVIYELDDPNGNIGIYYTEFDENWIKASNKTIDLPNPEVTSSSAKLSENSLTIDLNLSQNVFVAGNPTLTLTVGDNTLNAEYIKGSGTNKLVFKTTLTGNESGKVIATNIDETNGIVENTIGGKITEVNESIYDLTKVSKTSYEGVDYTTQHSNSTAENTDGAAVNVIDGNANTYWHSTWGNSNINLPQSVTLKLKEETKIYKLSYIPRQNSSSGRVKEYEILVSTDGINFTKVASGTFLDNITEQSIDFIPVNAKYIKFQVNYAYSGGAAQSAAVAELSLYKYTDGLFGEVDKSELIAEVDNAKEVIKGEYSQASINKVQEMISKAEEILNASIVSENMIDNAIKNLKDSGEALVNISNILNAILEFESMDSEDYTTSSWEAYRNAIDEAKDVAKMATTKKQVTDILVKVIYMKSNLIEEVKVDKKELNTLYENCKSFVKDDYTEESWKVFEQAFINAEKVINNLNATQEEVNLALSNLQAAVSALENAETEVDKTELQKLYSESLVFQEDEYTIESWLIFSNARELARDVLDSKEATKEQVNNALDTLNLAISKLEKIKVEEIDVTSLQSLINLVEGIDLKLYAEKGQAEFNDALEYAREVLLYPQSNERVMEAVKSLSKAYLDLRLLPDKELINQLINFIDEVKDIDINKYSLNTKNTILKVVENVKNLLQNANMTEEEVLVAIDEINDIKLLMANEDNNIKQDNTDIIDTPIVEENNVDDKTHTNEDSIIKGKLPNTGSDSIYTSVILGLTFLGSGITLYKRRKVK